MKGKISVITGSMFSGKSTELIRRLERAKIAHKEVLAFRPSKDTREEKSLLKDRNGGKIECIKVPDSSYIIEELNQNYSYDFVVEQEEFPENLYTVDIIAIDEAQFFHENIYLVCQTLADRGVEVIVSGLDMDYKRKPFASTSNLLAVADDILKLSAVCLGCGDEAIYSYKKDNGKRLEVGDREKYTPFCRKCYDLEVTLGDHSLSEEKWSDNKREVNK